MFFYHPISRIQAEGKANELVERCAILEEKSKQLCDLSESAKGLAVNSGTAARVGTIYCFHPCR